MAPAQIVMGDFHGLNTLQHQPAKIAALEGSWEGRSRAPETLFGIPDMKAERTDYAIEVPWLGSLILTHSLDGRVPGLKDFKPEDRPNATIIFFTFRIMVALGFLMMAVGLFSLWLRWKGRLYDSKWLKRMAVAMAPAGFVALLCGWITTEVGRQPYTVYGVMRTSDSLSPIGLPGVATSLAAFAVVYLIVYSAGIYFLLQLMAKPPMTGESGLPQGVPTRTAGITPAPSLHADPRHPAQPEPAA